MKLMRFLCGFAIAASAISAHADILYNNVPMGGTANCAFTTACAAMFTNGDVYAAQQFTLSASANLTSGAFQASAGYNQPSGINWMILSDMSGIPGSVVSSGKNVSYTLSAGDSFYQKYSIDLSAVTLGAGTYYIAFQSISTVTPSTYYNDIYLARGASTTGAFQTLNGGVNWSSSYSGFPSVAVSISGTQATVPEPSSIALTGLGLLGLSAMRRRKSR